MRPRLSAAAVLAAAALSAACSSPPSPAGTPSGDGVVRIVARRFAFTPDRIRLKRGAPATLELVSADRKHGFNVEGLGIRADVLPGAPVRLTLTPARAGTFPFRCDLFCGSGHEGMNGVVEVVP